MTGQPRPRFIPGDAAGAPGGGQSGARPAGERPQVSMGLPDPLSEGRDLPPPLDPAARARDLSARGDVLYLSGDFGRALSNYREAVQLQPGVADYHFRLGSAAWKLGETRLIHLHFTEALRLNPRHLLAQDAIAQWSLYAGDMPAALDHSARTLALAPHDPNVIASRVYILDGAGQTQEAWRLLEPLIGSESVSDRAITVYALLATKIGHEAQAADMIERRLRDRQSSPSATADMHLAAVPLYDALGRYDEAFTHARQGNDLVRRFFDPKAHSAMVSSHINYFTKDRLRSLPRATHGNGRPVLIVGMPRSGTSLVEQILASHPDVFGAGELSAMGVAAQSIEASPQSRGARMPGCLDSISLGSANIAAADYLGQITALNSTARYVTDKMPWNFVYLGLAQVLLHECHVIHCVRDPRDTCLSCYFTNFGTGNAFTFNLNHLAGFYRDYRRAMDHWKKVSSLPMLEVEYEQVVADLPGQTRRMLEFLDLPWDERCLKFHENKRQVPTASRDQVRKPLYASSVGRWKHYEKHIPELLALVPGGG
ncbi:MAG: sulfotransferase [Phycisphaerales bacterium]|nr:sulfotransferase [Phycisphaerales bacterium]